MHLHSLSSSFTIKCRPFGSGRSCSSFQKQPFNPTLHFHSCRGNFSFFSCFLGFLALLFMLPNNGCPTIFILVSKVGIDRTDSSLGIGTVVFCVLSGWYSSTRQCDSSTVALETRSHHIEPVTLISQNALVKYTKSFTSSPVRSRRTPSLRAVSVVGLYSRGTLYWCWNRVLGHSPPSARSSFCAILERGGGWEFNCYSNAVVDANRRCEKCAPFGFDANSSVSRPVSHEHTTKSSTSSPVRSRRTPSLRAVGCRLI